MSDLISRQAAIDALRMDISIIPYAKAREYVRAAIETIYNRLEELPSAEPERKKGEWLANGDIPKECPFCGEDWDKYVFGDVVYTGELPKFCPNCGIKMER